MTKFTIEYNPYIQKITFRKNDTILNSKNRIGAKSKNRLQELLGDQLANWEGLFNEIENECNDDEIDLKFRGRKIDYEDLQETLKYYAGDVKFHLSCEEMKNDDDLLKELDKIFEEIKRKNEEIIEWNNNHRQKIEAKKAILDIYRVKLVDILKETKNTLETYYRKDIIYPKYRSLIPISSFCDYLQSGVCETLEGHEGCYNKFDLEVRLDTIISRIDDVIDNLDQIKFNQHTLYEEVVKCNEKLDNLSTGISEMTNNITGSIEEVKAKTVAAINGNDHSNTMLEYYAEETLHNVNNIKWLQQMDYIDRGGHAW